MVYIFGLNKNFYYNMSNLKYIEIKVNEYVYTLCTKLITTGSMKYLIWKILQYLKFD